MVANSVTKALLVIKHEYFLRIIKIREKKELLASIKQKDDLRDTFQ